MNEQIEKLSFEAYFVEHNGFRPDFSDSRVRYEFGLWQARATMDLGISVKDRLPKNGDQVLIHLIKDGVAHVSHLTSLYSNGFRLWTDNGFESYDWFITSDKVTHWQPLPSSPVEFMS